MKHLSILALAAVTFLVVAPIILGADPEDDQKKPNEPTEATDASNDRGSDAGSDAAPTSERGSVDPKTLTVEQKTSTSSDGLVLVDSPVPNGGVMVDLRGRFRSTATATIDETGNLVIGCGDDDPAAIATRKAE